MVELSMADGADHPDLVDLLLKVAIFGCFVVFAAVLLFIRIQRDKRKKAERETSIPSDQEEYPSRMARVINRCIYDAGQQDFMKVSLMEMTERDEVYVEKWLRIFEAQGFLKIVKPIAEASAKDVCVKVFRPIEQNSIK